MNVGSLSLRIGLAASPRETSNASAAAKARIEGLVHPTFAPVARELLAQINAAGRGGGAVAVYHGGEKVVDIWAGARDAAGNPWQRDTIVLSFSTTKGVVSTLAHVLADRGILDLDAPVARYWPEFGYADKSAIRISDLLAHRAGLHLMPEGASHGDDLLDWDKMTDALARSPVRATAPRSAYHALTFGFLVGETIRRATGGSVGDALRRYVAEPLGAPDLHIGAPTSERHRLAELLPGQDPARTGVGLGIRRKLTRLATRGALAALGIDSDTIRRTLAPPGIRKAIISPKMLDVEMPSLNGVFGARDLARMYAMLGAGGTLDGARILSPNAIGLASTPVGRGTDAVLGLKMRWALGYHLVGTSRGIIDGAFGHFGFGGSGAWVDPKRKLAVAMTLNRVAGTPVGDLRMARLSAIAVACADARGLPSSR